MKLLEKEYAQDLGLDVTDSTYAIGFLLNSKMNNAADPIPFKVAESALEQIASTAIGKPWIPGVKGKNSTHIRKEGVADQTDVIDFHRNHAGGTIVQYYINPITKNVSVIVKLFPDFIAEVRDGKVSDYLSPMLGNITQDETTGEVTFAEIVHLHSVDVPGYEKAIAKFAGTCTGPIGQCMKELTTLAASGQLKEYRDSSETCPVLFLKGKQSLGSSSMSAEPIPAQVPKPAAKPVPVPAPAADGSDPVMTKLDEIGTSVASMGDEIKKIEAMEDNNAGVLKEVAAAAGIDSEKVMTMASMGNDQPPIPNPAADGVNPMPPKPYEKPNGFGAAGTNPLEQDNVVSQLKIRVEQLEKEKIERKKKELELMRTNQALVIAQGEVLLHENGLTKADIPKRIKHYVGLKNTVTNEPLDLTLLSYKYKTIVDTKLESIDAPQTTTQDVPIDAIAASGYSYDSGYPVNEPTAPTVADLDKLEDSI